MISDVLRASRGDIGDREQPAVSPAAAEIQMRQGHLGGLIHHLSHEIRTPLQSMLALSHLLRDGRAGELNPEQQRYVDVILRSGQSLARLVNDLLDLSRIELGQVAMELAPLDLRDRLDAVAAKFAGAAETKQLRLRVESMENLPLVRGDPARVEQVLGNLVENAIRFTARGQVVLSAESRDDAVVAVRVSDTGIGIPEGQCAHLFDELDPTEGAESHGGGPGLRLTISRRLARLMGGDLSVESDAGLGSCFTLALPMAGRAARPTPNGSPIGAPIAPADRGGSVDGSKAAARVPGGAAATLRSRNDQHGTNPTGR